MATYRQKQQCCFHIRLTVGLHHFFYVFVDIGFDFAIRSISPCLRDKISFVRNVLPDLENPVMRVLWLLDSYITFSLLLVHGFLIFFFFSFCYNNPYG